MHGTIYEFEQLPRAMHAPALAHVPRTRAARLDPSPLVGVIRNPRSHRNSGHPEELADHPNVLTRTPRTRAALRETLAGFARRGIDYLVVDGGDGTVRDVLTCGEAFFAGRWPELIVLPKGKTNALAVDLGVPSNWSLGDALAAAARGSAVERRPLVVELPPEPHAPPTAPTARVLGFILGAGVFTRCTQAAQQAHRHGAFDGLAVLLTIVWGLVQTLFGGAANAWRGGTAMRLSTGPERRPLPDSGHGGAHRRFLLFASTLQRFPLGLRPFGRLGEGLKLGVLDAPLRRLLALVPLLALGFDRPGLARLGLHRIEADEIQLELGDRFILDGEYFPAGRYALKQGPTLRFVVP